MAATTALAEPFGRFGYAPRLVVPGMSFDTEGFGVSSGTADRFRFENKSIIWVVQETSATGQTVTLTGAGGGPAKVRANLWGEGLEMFFRAGIRLRLSSTTAPYLTWAEGSVGPGVPTPKTGWCLVSFRDSQPPVLFAFQGGQASLVMDGKAGDWVLRSEGGFSGWVRGLAPMGTTPVPTNSAKALGTLLQTLRPFVDGWREPTPALVSQTIIDSPTAVQLSWVFDRPGAVVPPAVILGPLGGYGPKTTDATTRLPAVTEEGPTTRLSGTSLTMRFPVRRVPAGRALGVGKPTWQPPATVSAIDPGSVGELALSILTAWSDPAARQAGTDALSSLLGESEFVEEPYTGASLPYGVDGAQAGIVAAHALLMQAMFSTESASSSGNSLLTSLAWRRDAMNWRFWGVPSAMQRQVGAFAALAGAICPEPERRLEGALFETGLAAERGLQVWLRRRDPKHKVEPLAEPWAGLRAAFFGHAPGSVVAETGFVDLAQSGVRVYGDVRVWLETEPEGSYRMQWQVKDTRPGTLILATSTPVTLTPLSGLSESRVEEALGFVVVRYTPQDAGTCTMRLRLPDFAAPLPKVAAPPAYAVTNR